MLIFNKAVDFAERHGWPTCGKCNKPVEKLVQQERVNFNDGIKLVAYCHGEYEAVEIPDGLLFDMRRLEELRVDGIAFSQKPLLPT